MILYFEQREQGSIEDLKQEGCDLPYVQKDSSLFQCREWTLRSREDGKQGEQLRGYCSNPGERE